MVGLSDILGALSGNTSLIATFSSLIIISCCLFCRFLDHSKHYLSRLLNTMTYKLLHVVVHNFTWKLTSSHTERVYREVIAMDISCFKSCLLYTSDAADE